MRISALGPRGWRGSAAAQARWRAARRRRGWLAQSRQAQLDARLCSWWLRSGRLRVGLRDRHHHDHAVTCDLCQAAARQSARAEAVHFHMLHKKDLSRVKEVWYCAEEDKPIERSEIVKGYEYGKGRYVVVSSGLPWWTRADQAKRPGLPLTAAPYRALQSFGDYIVFKGGIDNVLAEGRFDNSWKLPPGVAEKLRATGAVEVR